MSKDQPDPNHPYWVRSYYSNVMDSPGDLASERVFRDEFSRNIEIALLEGEYWVGRIEHGRNPDKSYYKGPVHCRHEKDGTPRTPCYKDKDKPCIDLNRPSSETYRIFPCEPGECNRS